MVSRTTITHMRALVFVLTAIALPTSATVAQTWTVLSPTLSHTVVLNPNDPDKLYVGNWANQLFHSNDRGTTWSIVELGDLNVPNFLTSIVVPTADTGTILVGGFNFDGIKRSSDGGASWRSALSDTVSFARMWFISEAIVEDPKRPGLLYAARGATDNSIWRSSDNGATWDSISTIPRALTGRLCTMAIRPDSTNILFVGALGGQMFRSDDSGRTWARVPVLKGARSIRSDSEIPKIVFSPRDPMTGYAVVTIVIAQNIEGNGGVLKTTDGGATWDRIAFADTSLWAVDVRTTNGQDEVFVGGFRVDNTPTSIKGDGLVFRSTDGGTTWSPLDGVPWGTNELGDTIRNMWVIRCDPSSRRVYFAAATGLYALDEVVSVLDVEQHSAAIPEIRAQLRDELLEVESPGWNSARVQWNIVNVRGAIIARGEHAGPLPLRISTQGVAPGLYAVQLFDGHMKASASLQIPVR